MGKGRKLTLRRLVISFAFLFLCLVLFVSGAETIARRERGVGWFYATNAVLFVLGAILGTVPARAILRGKVTRCELLGWILGPLILPSWNVVVYFLAPPIPALEAFLTSPVGQTLYRALRDFVIALFVGVVLVGCTRAIVQKWKRHRSAAWCPPSDGSSEGG